MRAGPRCGRLRRALPGVQGLAVLRGGMIAAAPRAAMARVESAVCGDAGDLLIGRDLVQKFGQHRCVAHVAGGELCRPDFQRLRISSDVDLAPDAPFRAAVPAGVPLPFALDLDAPAGSLEPSPTGLEPMAPRWATAYRPDVDQEVQRPL